MGEIDIDLENNDIEVYKEVVKEEKPLKKKKKEVNYKMGCANRYRYVKKTIAL